MFFRKLLHTSAVLVLLGYSSQALAAFQDPSTSSWGGWDRESGATIYVQWDNFSYDTGPGIPPNTDASPDVGSYGAVLAGVTALNPTTLVTSTENLYTPAGQASFRISVIADVLLDTSDAGVSVALQLSTLGTPLDPSSVTLDDGINAAIAPDSFSMGTNGGFTEWLFLWTVPDISTYFFNLSSVTNNLSLAEVSVDIGPAPIPVPAAVWLFGSALLGLGALRKKA